MYDFEWHAQHSSKTRRSAEKVWADIREILPFDSVLDVGCGNGLWLKSAEQYGCTIMQGVDGAWTDQTALEIPASAFTIADLEQPLRLGRSYDIAVSLEVAEHLSPHAADVMVDNLVAHADFVMFSAAIPFQGGYRHVNECWQSFWKEKFAARNFACFDAVRPLIWNEPDVHFWYKQNLLIYVNCARADLTARVTGYMADRGIVGLPIDMIHPEKYEAIASYRQIAFRPLARQLPGQIGAKVKSIFLAKV